MKDKIEEIIKLELNSEMIDLVSSKKSYFIDGVGECLSFGDVYEILEKILHYVVTYRIDEMVGEYKKNLIETITKC